MAFLQTVMSGARRLIAWQALEISDIETGWDHSLQFRKFSFNLSNLQQIPGLQLGAELHGFKCRESD
jgi:hypothetical protein